MDRRAWARLLLAAAALLAVAATGCASGIYPEGRTAVGTPCAVDETVAQAVPAPSRAP
ncbi:MAG: hypothetical protein KBA64_14855 [Armatimonadetes bacterium]|jgi:hypothetical protein|nr:hypothetical protein [Armatimonadota bacterium]MDI9601818.1 hypothetical protein [Acidobacteriota bacterium]NLN91487.1 hypothetical protein [candidate division WS1 bacterium]